MTIGSMEWSAFYTGLDGLKYEEVDFSHLPVPEGDGVLVYVPKGLTYARLRKIFGEDFIHINLTTNEDDVLNGIDYSMEDRVNEAAYAVRFAPVPLLPSTEKEKGRVELSIVDDGATLMEFMLWWLFFIHMDGGMKPPSTTVHLCGSRARLGGIEYVPSVKVDQDNRELHVSAYCPHMMAHSHRIIRATSVA